MDQRISDQCTEAANFIRGASHVVALTGAGISVDSGIPHFRGKDGIWTRYDPMEYAELGAFIQNPRKIWGFLHELYSELEGKEPNPGHIGLAQLEHMGYLKAIITQNIDMLHQRAGNTTVLEVHGSGNLYECLECNTVWERTDPTIPYDGEKIPLCQACSIPLKPKIVFFGEMLPGDVLQAAHDHTRQADVLIVAGTSASVVPVSSIPYLLPKSGKLIEINLERTPLTNSRTDLFIQDSTTTVLPKIVECLSTSA
jgi:NAD-dependent deacetylase